MSVHSQYGSALYEALRDRRTLPPLIEQNAALALEVAQRAYVIEGGRIVTTGNPKELMTQPHIRQAYLGEAA